MFELLFCKSYPTKDKEKKYRSALCLLLSLILFHKFHKTKIEISIKLIILRYTQVSTSFFTENFELHKKKYGPV